MSSAWTPDTCPDAKAQNRSSEVNAPYFALTYVASFLNRAKNFRVIPVQESESTVVYAGYESGKLARIAIVNLPGEGEDGYSTDLGRRRVDVQIPLDVAYFRQEAQINLASVRSRHTPFWGHPRLRQNVGQIPLGDMLPIQHTAKDGLLSVMLEKAEALLLVPQY